MGIDRNFAAIILQEHAKKTFGPKLVTVGRQTVLMEADEARALAISSGLKVGPEPKSVPVDTDTLAGAGNAFIRDDAFFKLMGIKNAKSLDVTDYEGADIICDLNEPLDEKLEGTADVIIDGSTLDNVFDPAMALRNLTKMLSDNGRIFLFNMGSNHNVPYIIPTPLWLFDYFVVNAFTRCDVYVVATSPQGVNVLMLDPETIKQPPWIPNVTAGDAAIHLIVVAERGPSSTCDKTPVQHQYRSEAVVKAYERRFSMIKRNAQPSLISSTIEPFVHIPPGYKFISA